MALRAKLSDTSVFVAGLALPLQATSAGRLDAVLPIGLKDSTTHQLLVRRGNTYSLPEPVSVATTQPAVFTVDESGPGSPVVFEHDSPSRIHLSFKELNADPEQ